MPNVIYKHKEVVSYDYLCRNIAKDEEIRQWLKEAVDISKNGVRIDPIRIFKPYPFKDNVEVTLLLPTHFEMFFDIVPKEYFANFIIEFESNRDYAFFKIKYM